MAHFWLFLDLRPLVVLFLSFLAPHASSSSQQSTSTTTADQCKTCRFLVKSFMEGLDLTESHFGGGNTDWEEKKLGKFSTSETRFVEAMEFTCKSEDKDSRFKCHSMAEKYEEFLEQWFFQHQDDSASNLEQFLCSEQLKVCCPAGQFGPDCQPCPGLKISATACFGRGLCDGSGSREGNGSCRCWDGYVGKMCSNCDSNHFPTAQNASFIECKACFVGCASGCSGEGPKGCRACATGFEMDAEQGCQDIDECARGECAVGNQVCVNNVGSFECHCMPGFKRSEESGECELDFEDAKSLEPDNSNVRKEGDEEEEPEEEEEEQSKKDENDDDENDDDAGMASLKDEL